jgi:hypothetical protein
MATTDIGVLSEKVSNLEQRFDEHSIKLEDKLDQIVEVMQKVASLQERENINSEKIKELQDSRKDIISEHQHMSEVMNIRLDKHVSDMNVCRDNIVSIIQINKEQLETRLKDTTTIANNAKEEVNKWLNRGIGAWVIVSSCLILLQIIAGYFIKEIKIEYSLLSAEVKELHNTTTQIQRDIYYISKERK